MHSVQLNIALNFRQILDAVKQLTPTERLKLNDALWEQDIDIPIEHQTLVLQRIQKAEKNPDRLLDWDQIAATL